MKIFLIEDSAIQIERAKEQLAGYEVIIASCANQGKEILKEACPEDIVISGLELSLRAVFYKNEEQDESLTEEGFGYFFKAIVDRIVALGSNNEVDHRFPLIEDGLDFFNDEVLPRLVGGKIKGAALLSDFEHIVAAQESRKYKDFKRLESVFKVMKSVSKYNKNSYHGFKHALDLVCLVDGPMESYNETVFYLNGEKFTNNQVFEKFRGNHIKKWMEQGGIILKQYKKVVGTLING